MSGEVSRKIPLDLTHVLYDDSSTTSHILALLTLSPILINPAYAVLTVQTRELFFAEMWAGQMFCEAFNWVLKQIVREDRPHGEPHDFTFSLSGLWLGSRPLPFDNV
ncbi:uncharacterized protein FIBRA_04627 [Fibroporia radiculosa]|uniref:Uncharacterized protein n=1 Tax=Fibroporia radiculosa TaxID=599839 RepID=J4GPJ8_9APHY|nr:uncharacterized protein FIBRA_04627 [Fibroporia radiculosa]CCM02525.1 predicted protein [Fibroporia radiculosa]